MEPMEPVKKYAMISSKYMLCRLLGEGGFAKVKYAFNRFSKQYFAIKIIKIKDRICDFELAIKEINVLRVLSHPKFAHPNIARLVEYYIDVDYIKKNGTSAKDKVTALVMEHIEGPNLKQFLQGSGRFQERIARRFFIVLIDIVEHLHGLGIAHRDIKLENLMLDKNYNLKIIDFGISDDIRARDLSGTLYAMAPEFFLGTPENGACADLFAAGVVPFMMVASFEPFTTATCKDRDYSLLMSNLNDKFWEIHEARIANGNHHHHHNQDTFFSQDFKSLMNVMLSPDPNLRLSLAEVKAHPWLKGDVATHEELCEEFGLRKQVMRTIIESHYMAKKQESKDMQQPLNPERGFEG